MNKDSLKDNALNGAPLVVNLKTPFLAKFKSDPGNERVILILDNSRNLFKGLYLRGKNKGLVSDGINHQFLDVYKGEDICDEIPSEFAGNVIVIETPISERMWNVGDTTEIHKGQIRLGGCWFDFDDRFKVVKI